MSQPNILKLIRKIVREEVRKIVKPMINEVLAEQFIRSLNESKRTIPVDNLNEIAASQPVRPKVNREAEKAEMRKKLLEKVAGDDPMKQLIYGDVEINPGMGSLGNSEGYVDTEDEGVDLSQFGL